MAWWDVPAKLPDVYDVHSQDKERSWISFPVEKIDWRPASLEEYLVKISNSTKEQLEEAKKIQYVFNRLREKYWDNFNQKDFIIEPFWFDKETIQEANFDLFILKDKKTWKIIAFINQEWKTLLDMTTFNPYPTKEAKIANDRLWFAYKQDENWKWIYIQDGVEYTENTETFKRCMLTKILLKEL